MSDNYVSDDMRSRADDIVWRVRCGDRDVYVLLEFQSSNEPFMAVRVLTYEGLLYQDLLRGQRLASRKELPAVLPIVLYNGLHRWSAPEDLASSFPSGIPKELERYVPQCRYLLIDEGRYAEADLSQEGNAVAALFRLENCSRPEQVPAIVDDLMMSLERAGQHTLRRAFRLRLSKVLLARLGKRGPMMNDLWEEQTMLSERVAQWEAEFVQQGRQEGEVALLMRLLRRRFGDLPPSIADRLKSAEPAQLERWSDRLLDARSLGELFDC